MKYWIISDTHFGHRKLVDIKSRPQGFENKIIQNIQNCVKTDDIFIHLGDFCIGDDSYWNNKITSMIPCKKWLVLGNHDKKSTHWYLENGWDFAAESFTLIFLGHQILFSHIPQKENEYTINIHGHLHHDNHRNEQVKHLRNNKQFLIAIENTSYSPLNLKYIIETFDKKNYKNSK